MKITRCLDCNSTNVSPAYDAENGISGLYSCEDCEILRNEGEFVADIKEEAVWDIVSLLMVGNRLSSMIKVMFCSNNLVWLSVPHSVYELAKSEAETIYVTDKLEDCYIWAYILKDKGTLTAHYGTKEINFNLDDLRNGWLKFIANCPQQYANVMSENYEYKDLFPLILFTLFGYCDM